MESVKERFNVLGHRLLKRGIRKKELQLYRYSASATCDESVTLRFDEVLCRRR